MICEIRLYLCISRCYLNGKTTIACLVNIYIGCSPLVCVFVTEIKRIPYFERTLFICLMHLALVYPGNGSFCLFSLFYFSVFQSSICLIGVLLHKRKLEMDGKRNVAQYSDFFFSSSHAAQCSLTYQKDLKGLESIIIIRIFIIKKLIINILFYGLLSQKASVLAFHRVLCHIC